MTPCSAACVGRFSSRPSSRSTCLRTSSGRSIAASCSRSSLASAADSSNSPSSSWIALSCWRRTNSRCVRSISDCTWFWISEPIEMTSSSRASTSARRRSRRRRRSPRAAPASRSVGSRSEPAMRWLSALASSTLATAICSSSGRYGHGLDDLRERLLDVAHERRELGRLLDDVGQLGDLGDEVGLLAASSGRCARAGRPGRAAAACRRGPSASARRRRRRRRRRGRRARAPRARACGWRP